MATRRPVPPTGVGGASRSGKVGACRTFFPNLAVIRTLLVIVCVATYWNSLSCDFVFDDVSAVKDNKDLRPSSPWINILQHDFWGTDMRKEHSHKSYRPLTVLSFRFNYWLHELEASGYHAVNLILHSVVCVLYHKMVVVMTSSLSKRRSSLPETVGLVSSLLFAVQPVHTEAVTGVVGRAELISSIFFILTILHYETLTRRGSWHWSVFMIPVLATLAMLSKEQGITVLGICFVYEVFVVQGLDIRQVMRRNKTFFSSSSSSSSCVPRCVVIMVAGLFLMFIRFHVMGSNLPVFTNFDNPASYEPAPTKQLTWTYLLAVNSWLLLSPSELCCDWTMKTIPLVESAFDPRNICTIITIGTVTCVGCVGAFGGRSKGERDVIMVSLSLVALPFLPASNLFFPVGFVVAERVLYIPSMGFSIIVALGLTKVYERIRTSESSVVILKTLFVWLLLTHGAKTVLRNFDWKNELSVFVSGIAVNPNNAKLWNNVGHAYEATKEYETALRYFRKASEIQQDDVGAHINVGRTLNNLGRFGPAERAYLKAKDLMPRVKPGQPYTARIAPQHLSVFLNLGNLIAKDANRLEEADALYRRAISMRADYVQAYIQRGDVLIKMGRREEASQVYSKALSYEPGNPDLHYNLGVVFIESGQPLVALEHFDRALSLDPDHIQSLTNSAVLMQETGREDLRPTAYARLFKVIEKYRSLKDKKVVGGLERIYFNLGMLDMDDGDMMGAEDWFEKAIELKPDFRSALFNLALLLNEQKRPLDAFPHLQQLLRYYPDHVKCLILLGDIYTNHVKDLKAAEQCYRKIVEIDPSHIQGKHNLCVVLVEQGHLDDGYDCLKAVQKMAPEEKYIVKHLEIVESRLKKSRKTTSFPASTQLR